MESKVKTVAKEKKWMKFRHKVVRNILFAILKPYSRWKYGIKVEKFKEQEKRPYLILMNHQTPFDQFFVGMAFRGPVYYLATEDIFSNGFVSSVIRYLVAPIPIKKQTTDVKAIKTCLRVAKEGGTIAIAPEGNRTYSGRTEHMSATIAPLARKMGMPIALYRLEGGYGAQPRWSDVIRKGKMRGYVSRVISPEEYAQMTDEELFSCIQQGLYVNEAVCDSEYRHAKLAEYLERAMYVCPFCGLSEFESHKDKIRCKKCNREIQYLPTKELQGVGFEFPFPFVAQWYEAQADFINALDVTKLVERAVYTDCVKLSEVIPCKQKKLIAEGVSLELYGNRIEWKAAGETTVCPFEEISAVAVLGRNKLNVYFGGKIYQIRGEKRFNALKYLHFYHRYKNIAKGDTNGKFLGL